jgi:hypothetical protein
MNSTQTQETSTPLDFRVDAPCKDCDRVTRHLVLATAKTHWQSEGGHVDGWHDYRIIQCQGCLDISFCELSEFSEDTYHDEDGNEIPNQRKIYYPARVVGRSEMKKAWRLPKNIYAIYVETHASFCSELSIMAGLGIRAIIEAVCKDQCTSGKDLKEKIDSLCELSFITKVQKSILHSLRFMGNAAAHEMKAHSTVELSAALDIVEHLLYGVYFIRNSAISLPSRDS